MQAAVLANSGPDGLINGLKEQIHYKINFVNALTEAKEMLMAAAKPAFNHRGLKNRRIIFSVAEAWIDGKTGSADCEPMMLWWH